MLGMLSTYFLADDFTAEWQRIGDTSSAWFRAEGDLGVCESVLLSVDAPCGLL